MLLDIICDRIKKTIRHKTSMIPLTDVVKGDRLKFLGFGDTSLPYRQRLLSLGITPGVEFAIIRVAPFGCPIQIEVRGSSLTLRKDEANKLLLERL